MNILNLEHVSKRYVSRPILTDVTIGIEDRDRIGVVGINGTGKSTFLSIVAGTEEPDEGQVIMRSGLRISCLPQEPPPAVPAICRAARRSGRLWRPLCLRPVTC